MIRSIEYQNPSTQVNFKCKKQGWQHLYANRGMNEYDRHYEKIENDKRHGPLAAQRLPKFDRCRTKYLRSRFPPRRGWF